MGFDQYPPHPSIEIKPSLNREGLEGFQLCCLLKRLLPAPNPSLIREGKNNFLKRIYTPKFASRFTVHPSPKKWAAFTLAEVLITLGIIGVVASITLPVVISKIEDRQNIVKWKKAYSTVNNAFNKVMSEGIPICQYRGPNTCVDDGSGYLYSAEFISAIKNELNVIDVCGSVSTQKNPLGFKKCGFDGDNI